MGSEVATIRLVTKGCPDPYCKTSKDQLIYWNHTCGSNAKLDDRANIHCFNCDIKYSILNSQFKCSNCQNWFKPNYSRLMLILGVLGTLKEEDYNSNISSSLSHREFIDFIERVVENLNNK